MQSIVNYARGWVRVRVCGAFPERFVNLCAQNGITFWAVEWVDAQTLRLTLLRRFLGKLGELAQRAGCSVEVESREGLPTFLGRFRRRYAFLMGLSMAVLAVCFCSNVVFTIQVTGNKQIPEAVILSQVRREGLRTGVYGPGLDTRQIALNTQLAVDGLSWVTVNLHGTRAEVIVREEVPVPDVLEKGETGDVLARADGLILSVDAISGQAQVEPGDVVARGEVLISGVVTLEGPQYSDIPPRYLHVRAEGAVRARTWRTVSACIPLTATVKEYTGREKERWSVTIFEHRINFYADGSILWSDYDKIETTHNAVLPSGQELSLALTREHLYQWQPKQVQVDLSAAQQLLESQLMLRLEEQVGEDGRVVCVDWSARIADGLLTVTAVAECEEQIGQQTKG